MDDHTLFTDAIRPILVEHGMAVHVVATAAEARDAVRTFRPDLVLMDLGLPDQSGLAVGGDLLTEQPDLKILALSAVQDRRIVDESLRVGFHGYLTKDTPVRRLVSAIESVSQGQIILPRRLGPGPRQGRADVDAALLIEQLTRREREVLSLLTEGASGSEIADRLGVTPNTVRTHIQSILTKLQVHTRLEAAAFAVRHGLVDDPLGRRAR